MAIKLGATGITFQDNSVQTTAGGPVTTQYAIGSYVLGRPQNSTNYDNATIAGTSLYASFAPYAFNHIIEGVGFTGYTTYQATISGYGVMFTPGTSLVNTGSWRCVSLASGSGAFGAAGLWVRYA
jgi:hypothetical protein